MKLKRYKKRFLIIFVSLGKKTILFFILKQTWLYLFATHEASILRIVIYPLKSVTCHDTHQVFRGCQSSTVGACKSVLSLSHKTSCVSDILCPFYSIFSFSIYL